MLNKYEIEFSKEARNDFIDIVKYIKFKLLEPNIANKLANKIQERIYNISYNPKKYPIIDDGFICKLQLRKTIVNNYIIFYKIEENEKKIYIVRILYGKRNWINLL